MVWFNKAYKAYIGTLLKTIDIERERNVYLEKKVNELTQALLKKDTHVVVRMPDVPVIPAPFVPVVEQRSEFVPEQPDTWSRNWFGSQTIATPPQEQKVSAPKIK